MSEAPEAFMEGSFALYSLPDGGMVMAYRQKGEAETKQLVLPAEVIFMAQKMAGGDMMSMLKAITG